MADNVKLPFKITYAYDDRRNIYFFYRDEKKKKRLYVKEDFCWYFCVPLEDREIAKPIAFMYKPDVLMHSVVEGSYIKMYCNRNSPRFNPFITALKNANVRCLEMDLSLTKRFLIDSPQEMEEDLKIGYFDIETEDKKGQIEIGAEPVLAWSIVQKDGKAYFEMCEKDSEGKLKEKELLQNFLKRMDEFDLIVGWNSNDFDVPYLKERMLKHGISSYKTDGTNVWKRTMQVDLMMRLVKLFAPIMSILGLSGFSLNEVSRVFLKKQKIALHNEKIHVLFEKNPELLKEYNINDCVLLKELNDAMQTIPLMVKECVWTGSFMDKFFVGELLDNYILREAKSKNMYLKSKPNREETEKNKVRIVGGYVKEPLIGMYDNVRVYDFKSLYPTIIIGYNIGEDTIIKELSEKGNTSYKAWLKKRKIEEVDFTEWLAFLQEQRKELDPHSEYYQTANNLFFRKGSNGIISDLLKNLLEQRKQYKKEMLKYDEGTTEFANARAAQEVVKELTNSMFGITADATSRYFNPFVSESITITGQFWNRLSSDLIEKRENIKTLYADTDSVFLQIDSDDEAERLHDKLNVWLNEEVKSLHGLHPETDAIDLEYEKKYEAFILLDKKRYIGRLTWSNGKKVDIIHSRGTENIKRDTIPLTRQKMTEVIPMILDRTPVEDMISWVSTLKKAFFEEKNIVPEDFAITTKLSKPVANYKSKSRQVRIAERLLKEKKYIDIKERKITWGEKISYIVTDQTSKEGQILVSDYDGKIDRGYYWIVRIFAPIKRFLIVAYPDIDWLAFEDDCRILAIKELRKRSQPTLF